MSDLDVVVFLGPTLPVDEARAVLDATYLPPATRGDLLRAARQRPWAIGLVDGYFERVPAVWHKEILWAMDRGIHVFGAASMGALRAAELEMFGMEGVGRVFESLRDGELEDDDEVALIHTPAADGYRPLSEAMVNLRATLTAARDEGVLTSSTHDRLVAAAKALYYPERSYDALLDELRGAERAAFEAWLPEGRRDQKRDDALAMLRLIDRRRRQAPVPKTTRFTFQHTDAWAQLNRQADEPFEALIGGGSWLEELRLADRQRYAVLREQAWSRLFGLETASRAGGSGVDETLLQDLTVTFARDRGLDDPDALERWLDEQGMSYEELLQRLEEDARLERIRRIYESRWTATLRDQARLDGEERRYAARAAEKEAYLRAHGLAAPTLGGAGLDEDALWAWYFEEHLGEPRPADLDAYARSLDLAGVGELCRAVLREYLWRRRTGSPAPTADGPR